MSEQLKKSILDFFPTNDFIKAPRPSQAAVLKQIQDAVSDGIKFIILEAPVGSGKSAIAISIARWLGQAHVLTPRRSLQSQYFEDFEEHLVLMKGRSSYPCTLEAGVAYHKKVINLVKRGESPMPAVGELTTAKGMCKDDESIFKHCMDVRGICPYTAAIEVAQETSIVVHNLHSFIFQAHFGDKFTKRNVMIIDEAHEIEGIVRNFATKKFTIPKLLSEDELPGEEVVTIRDWFNYFNDDKFIPRQDGSDRRLNYLAALTEFEALIDNFGNFVVSKVVNTAFHTTKFEFIPESLGNLASTLLFNYGDVALLMSGTIYDKKQFCKNIGINPDNATFIKIGSSFPLKSRPIYMKPDYMVDTSHKMWRENFGEIIEKINTICDKFPDVKGLIHAPSYDAAFELTRNLVMAGNDRIVSHTKDDFQTRLKEFYDSKGNDVFISPVCQQGVDFKGDRARFQIILRVPYGNAGDEFMSYKVSNDFPWYNYQALVVFGQQIGRVNRSENDFGVTILLDERFPKFIKKNRNKLPKWVMDAIIE